jgi:hypothetical protein
VTLRAEEHPVDPLRARGIVEGVEGNVDGSLGPLEDETLDGSPRADDDVVSIGIAQTANDDAADAAETDDGNG